MKPIFFDPTPRWVPFLAAILVVGGVLISGWWNGYDPGVTLKICAALAALFLMLIVLHGRSYWKGQVEQLRSDGMRYEAKTAMWAGPGRLVSFAATEAKDWTARPGSGQTDDGKPKLGTIVFTVRGAPLEMSFVNPKGFDLGALRAINPSFFDKVKADYPALKSIG